MELVGYKQLKNIKLGAYNYKDWNFTAKFDDDSRFRRTFNDSERHLPNHDREHMIHLQCEGIFITSEAVPSPEMRKWKGGRNVCNQKSKKQMTYIGREKEDSFFPKFVVSELACFKGRENLPYGFPIGEYALWPLTTPNRTIYG